MNKPNKLLLIVNLGSPKLPESKEVGEFLDEFLMDPLVIDIPKPLRWLLVKKLIVPRRSPESAKAYSKIWMGQNGSPLVFHTKNMVKEISSELKNFHVDFAMRYNGPSLESTLNHYRTFQEIYLLPIYPQYAESSTETVFSEVKRILNKGKSSPKIFKCDYFYSQPEYLDTLTDHIKKEVEGKSLDHILFSYHGLPERHMKKLGRTYRKTCLQDNCCPQKFDKEHLCYRAQCFETTHLVGQKLKTKKPITMSTSFQSRLGKAEWIKPYTTSHIEDLVKKQGVKKLAVVCPSFICDCLETLEEIDMELREQFKELGGEEFHYIPAFNNSELWVKNMSSWVERAHASWPSLN